VEIPRTLGGAALMLYFIRHHDKEYRVRVESRNQQLFVRFEDEKEEAIDAVYYGNDCTIVHENKVFHANVVGDKVDYTVWLPQGNVHFQLESEYRRIVGMLRGQELGQENNVYAKMPGKIAKIMTKVGDVAEQGASLLVMEAMKMENEIRAGLKGTIANICVKEGQAVETGTLLIEMTPIEE
jgi:biotin carboxyl carrier protein